MEVRTHVLLVQLLLVLFLLGNSNCGPDINAIQANYGISTLNSSSFPAGFVFGTASSSYQYEGAAHEDGKGLSIWDTYTRKYPDKIKDRSNGDVAVDSYHRYKEDVKLMKQMGLDAYRFSISWSRILPYGKLHKGVNLKGLAYYHNLIDELIANGIKPFVTLFHWDIPQELEDEYGGFLSPSIVEDFRNYANICFKEFGDKVKHWITLNEPWSYSYGGYANGHLAPGRCSKWQQLNCTGGDSATEPYLVAHHQLLAHAAAVDLYRRKYKVSQKGIIGITLVSHWFVPLSKSQHDQFAVLRALDFMFGWFMNPITKGEYPRSMRSLVRGRLPKFSAEQSRMVNGSFDFLGLNYYTTYYAAYSSGLKHAKPSYINDPIVKQTVERKRIPIGPKAGSDWLYVYPQGIRDILLYVKRKYNNPWIFITENVKDSDSEPPPPDSVGVDEVNSDKLSLKEALNDKMRVRFYHDHLAFLHLAIKEGVNVKGYFAWSLLDNFEWNSGYTVRFGINFVDYKDGLKRHPKLSYFWFKKFLQDRK